MNGRSNNKRDGLLRAATRRRLVLLAFVALLGVVLVCSLKGYKATNEEGRASTPEAEPKDSDPSSVAGEYKALLIAADDYGSKASALPGAKRDVEALRARLLKIGFEERNIITLQTARTDNGEIDYDRLPQKMKIEECSKKFINGLKSGDFAIIVFVGHGVEEPRTKEAFFVPIDFDPKALFATSVSINAIMSALAKSAAKFRLLVVDACRSHPSDSLSVRFASRSAEASLLSEIANVPDSIVLMQSCSSGQNSYEGGFGRAKDIANGFFMLSLLEALDPEKAQANKNKDGDVTFEEMRDYVVERTKELASIYYNKEQTPTYGGANIVDFPILRNVLVEGAPYAEWKQANDAYETAKTLRRKGEYENAFDKIELACQIFPGNATYATEKQELRLLIAAVKAQGEFPEEATPTLTPEEAKARYLEGRRMAWGLDGTNVDWRPAFIALRDAAENGCVEAAGELAYFYLPGVEGKNVDFKQAKFWAEKGAEINDPTALFVMAVIYSTATIVEPDEKKAKAFARRAYEEFLRRAELGDIVASYWVGAMGGESDEEAARRVEEAAKAGLPAAMRDWGRICLYGLAGREKDDKEAEKMFRLAAKRGDPVAMFWLGNCFRFGWGTTLKPLPTFDDPNILTAPCIYDENGFVRSNSEEALEWYCKAAELGDPCGMTALGDCWAKGYGVEQNAEQAVVWYLKAAELGDPCGMTALGDCWAKGYGVEQNAEQAVVWYLKAAERGDFITKEKLARCYEEGFGVPQDQEKANELRRRFDEAWEAAEGIASQVKVDLEDFKNDVVPLKID